MIVRIYNPDLENSPNDQGDRLSDLRNSDLDESDNLHDLENIPEINKIGTCLTGLPIAGSQNL